MSSKRAHRLQISPDPQNLSWTSDKSSFGYKMLQKMGWTEGKGLGTNEDGNVEHVKIAKRIDNRGVGATYQTINAWKETNNHFDNILKTLNDAYGSTTPSSENGQTKKRKNSEEISSSSDPEQKEDEKIIEQLDQEQTQTKRIPRHLIYQKRHKAKNVMNYSKTDLSAILARPSDFPQKEESDVAVEDETTGNTYIHRKDSMYEYFSQKQIITTEEVKERASFGLGFSSSNGTSTGFQYNYINNEEDNNKEEVQPEKENKKKKKQVEETVQTEESSMKKQKKKKSKEVVEEHMMNVDEQTQAVTKKKKKQKKQQIVEEPHMEGEPTKKSKKKKKNKNEETNAEVVEDQPAEQITEELPKKKKKKKSQEVVVEDDGSQKKKKKKDKPSEQVVEEVQPENNNTEKKKKKKKKKTE